MSQPANAPRIPSLRFPEFSGEWEKDKLENLTSKIGSGSTPTGGEKVYTNFGALFIRSQNVNNNTLDLADKTYIPEEIHEKMKGSKVLQGDVLLNITGASIGRTCVVVDDIGEANVNQHVCIVRPNKTVNSVFLQSYLSSYRGQKLIYAGQTGSGREGLNFQSIASFNLIFPSLPEQTKIAAFLSSVDSKIDQLSQKKALLEQYKKGVMQQIFSQQIRFKADDGCDYPEWEEKKLGEVGTTYNGLTGKTADDFGDGFPYIQYKQIFDKSKIDVSKFGFVSIGANDKQNMVCYGDIFFTVSSETPNEVGYASVLLDDVDNLYLNSFCFGYRPNKLLLDSSFSQYLFRSNKFRKKVIPLAQGSTRYNISKTEFIKLTVMLPCLSEQTKIANFLSAIDSKIEQVAEQLETAKQFKKGLLQQMFV